MGHVLGRTEEVISHMIKQEITTVPLVTVEENDKPKQGPFYLCTLKEYKKTVGSFC